MNESALLLYNYINASSNSERNIDKLLDSNPSYREVTEIMSTKNIPHDHFVKLQEYKNAILETELKSFTEKQEKVPLMRSTITVVGRGRDGKTSTINSLKGKPFQHYCESTKGAKTSEVNVHEVGMHVTNVDVSGSNNVTFQEAVRDSLSTQRSISSQLWNTSIDRELGNEGLKDEEKNRSSDPHSNPTIATNHSREDNEPPLKRQKKDTSSKKEEEEDIAQKVDNVDLSSFNDGRSIRFTIYDNGGQKVFRSIQNILLSREGIFIVVFDMMKIYNEASRKEALEHLNYWISSIKMDACHADSDESTDPSIKYPPVILVGTHYDEFLNLKGDRDKGLEVLNKTLVDNLPLSDLVPLPHQSNDLPRDRQQLYNRAQNLCFWPVDNSYPNDANVQAIRRILLEAAINDPGFDIAQEVPISFLKAMDKLTAVSEEVPILPIDSNDPEESSVMNVMHECGVFEEGLNEDQKKLDICKSIVKQYQSLGHFLYFNQFGLEDYCILDPQWLINMITYIVRDFKLHRFHRDFNAMDLNNGEYWRALLNKGILEGSLLRKLWRDREHESFLTELMLELGIFGQLLGNVEALRKAKFSVPIAITVSSNESREFSMPALRDHLGVNSLDDAVKETINMSTCHCNLVPFYSRLVNRLISEWSSGHNDEKTPPELLPCAANLCLGQGYKFSILINEEHSTLDIFVSDKKKMNIVLKYISEACSFVNVKAYQNRLELGVPVVNVENEVILRHSNNATTTSNVTEIQETEECHPNLQALIDVFQNEKLARKIHEKAEDVTPEELIQMYYSDKDAFVKDILSELGIIKKLEQLRFIAILKSKTKPVEDELYAIFNFLDENDLAVKEEENRIVSNMRMSSYFSFAYKVLRDDEKYEKLHSELVAHQECKIVHFGMHGSSIDTFVTTTLASCLQESSVKCIFLNMCKSEHIANDLRDKAKTEKVVYWLSSVEDNAARAFLEAFYYYLCANKKANYLEFRKSFKFAQERLQLRGYLFIDPEEKKEALQNPNLKAAGIPKFHDSLHDQEADLAVTTTRFPNSIGSPSNNASGNATNSLTSITGVAQPDYEHSMEVDSTNALEQEENPSSSELQEEPTQSSTQTVMASRQPHSENSFSQSDIPSSKKRRQDENVVQRDSEGTGLETADLAHVHESRSVPSQKDQKQNKASRAMQNYRNKKCQIRCNYIFTKCNHSIVSSCQLIIYKNQAGCNGRTDKSLDLDIKEFKERGKCRSNLTQCEKCGIFYCSEKKVPSKGGSVVDKSCFEIHVCTSELKEKTDITISIKDRVCIKCNPLQLFPESNDLGSWSDCDFDKIS